MSLRQDVEEANQDLEAAEAAYEEASLRGYGLEHALAQLEAARRAYLLARGMLERAMPRESVAEGVE